jgi:hypothetical protein
VLNSASDNEDLKEFKKKKLWGVLLGARHKKISVGLELKLCRKIIPTK